MIRNQLILTPPKLLQPEENDFYEKDSDYDEHLTLDFS